MIRFFRINEDKGSNDKPSFTAIVAVIALFPVNAFMFHGRPIAFVICYLISAALCYLLFNSPIRTSLGWLHHIARESHLAAFETGEERQWEIANREILEMAGVKIFDPADMTEVQKVGFEVKDLSSHKPREIRFERGAAKS